jgi:hypothetical protein
MLHLPFFNELAVGKGGCGDARAISGADLELSAPALDVPDVLPASGFLGGSAPCLRLVELNGIPFPELPTHLLSFRDLSNITNSIRSRV